MEKRIYMNFKRGSRTYFYSTMFFPKAVKEDVFRLYSFVREADDLVDRIPQDREGFYQFRDRYRRAMAGERSGDLVVDSFVSLSREKGFNPKWTEAFFWSMESDLNKRTYRTIGELMPYLYGSAEVVGLFMSRVMNLSEAALPYARMLGRAMQYINFIRDIDEDLKLGRTYLPLEELEEYGLRSLDRGEALAKPKEFRAFIRRQVERYMGWQREAELGFRFIPTRYLLPIKTASDMYAFTARRILESPMIVYERKVKPSIPRILLGFAKNRLTLRGNAFSSTGIAPVCLPQLCKGG